MLQGPKVISSQFFGTYMYPSYQVLIALDQFDETTVLFVDFKILYMVALTAVNVSKIIQILFVIY